MTSEPQRQSPRRQPIARGDEEFARVLAFSDGLFAIAMTLLVVGIAVPELSNPGERELWDALRELDSAYVSFFISFVVIGRYWIAHHQFFRLLSKLDYGLIWGVLLSSTPVLFFIGSIPIAFASTTVAVLFWFGGIPLQLLVLNRWKPPNADDYFD